jgi:iron-sulfur cluster assembly 2
VFEKGGAKIVVDDMSYEFVKGATIDYQDTRAKANFAVIANPNAGNSCGCGSSFTPKDML